MIFPVWLPPLVSFVFTSVFAWNLHSWRVDSLEAEWKDKLNEAVATERQTCLEDQKRVQEIAYDLQDQLDRKDTELAAARKRLHQYHPSGCVSVANPSGNNHDSGNKPEPGSENGVRPHPTGHTASVEDLMNLAGEGEEYRLQLGACQAFIRQVWAANNVEVR